MNHVRGTTKLLLHGDLQTSAIIARAAFFCCMVVVRCPTCAGQEGSNRNSA
ncbi:MAG TPA: hypothetical protein VMH22_03640 [bacterium]|nr:hypothetical protein [bacterium]